METNLSQIIKRLAAMVDDKHPGIQSRMFNLYGIPLCEVQYYPKNGRFIVEMFRPEQHFEFDKLDLAAIEVYQCLEDFRESF
ncbi:MAG: YkuJ family protein [[Lactobacillus] timonensis]|jgi:uncharacterized protein YkuJ|uniref:DUF1797 family protein n=1 Tax=[Lactobacillus] timonensis TaxID=1970790 RepID=UPI001F373E65|nr:DUF1797 family protein [[Lactobacillus] timonensis]MCI1926338.1 YkuJ family protein [[Lactobacillus] timonensis]MCI1957699.1 YkuJ family protein [[Lactobacillus] timonensis]MCI1970694.1 YkuJ family protein [[Lactobacillus] timonensis]MCI2006840.1 YkuJ family protein [[Lactobacillus] timonensis]